MNRNQFIISKCTFKFSHKNGNTYFAVFENGTWKVEWISGDGRARTINDLPENRARQFLNETRAKEILIAALQKKEPVIGTRPANKKTRKKVNKLRV